ncbi:hypothetical protein JKP88DRAFT_255462 [Tribonema minus]|uniref:Uncharacterized protein n=1 Tax=Tribonema minus TaxID=303371 RepID=A0A835Z1A4_9STRA|nr:hypothetical protein JKP88DRAFT_255462 [Tribonema minus]
MPLSRIKGVVVIFGLKIGDRTGYGVYGTLIQEIEAALRAQVPHAHRTHMLKFLGLVWGEEGLLVFYHMHYQMAPRKLVRVISNYFKRARIFNEIARLPFNARDHLQVQERIGVYTRAGGRGGVCDYMPNIRWEKALPSTRSKKVLAPVAKYSSDTVMTTTPTSSPLPASLSPTRRPSAFLPPLGLRRPFRRHGLRHPCCRRGLQRPCRPLRLRRLCRRPGLRRPCRPLHLRRLCRRPGLQRPCRPLRLRRLCRRPGLRRPCRPLRLRRPHRRRGFWRPCCTLGLLRRCHQRRGLRRPCRQRCRRLPPPADEDGIDMLAGAAMGLDRLAASDAAVYGGDIDDLFSIDDNDPLFRRDLLDDPLFNNFPLLRDLSLGSSDDNGSPNPCSFDAAPEESAQPDALSFVIAADVEVQMPTARATAATMAAVRHGTSTAPIVFDRLINNNRATPVVTAMDVEADAGTGRAPAPGEVMEAVTHAQGPEQVPDEAEAGGGGGGGGEATGAAGVHAPEEAPEEAAAEAAGGVQAGSNRMPMTGADMDAEMLAMLGVTRAMVNHRVR